MLTDTIFFLNLRWNNWLLSKNCISTAWSQEFFEEKTWNYTNFDQKSYFCQV